MPDVFTLIDDAGGTAELVGSQVRLKEKLTLETSALAIVERNRDGTIKRFEIPITSIPRIRELTASPSGRVFAPPQRFYDDVAIERADPDLFPDFGTPTHVSVKDGLWSDPTVWSAGTVPGENAKVHAVGTHVIDYDLHSDVKLHSLLTDPLTTLRFPENIATRMVIYSVRTHGKVIKDGEHEFLYWFPEGPGTTTKGGWVCAGITRINGRRKRARSTCPDLPAGTTTITLDNAPLGWGIGDEITIAATDYSGTTPTDATYTGPTVFWSPTRTQTFTNNQGFMTSQDEVRTITAIAGNTITLNAPLTFDHIGDTGVLPNLPFTGPQTSPNIQTIVLQPYVCIRTQSIVHRTLGGLPEDDAIWADGDLSNNQKRAIVMFIHNDDQEARHVQCRDMGRTQVDPSMMPDIGPAILASNGGPSIINPLNANYRHAVNIRSTGPYLSRKAVRLAWFTVDTTVGAPPIPGWGVQNYASRANIEHSLVHNVRGACYGTARGNEIGQQLANTACHARGDGYATGWSTRAEVMAGHMGHYGIGFCNMSRQTILHGNVVTSCKNPYDWMPNNHETTNTQENFERTSVRDVDLRLYDPLTQGGEANGPGISGQDFYGPRQPQIADFVGNKAYACSGHSFVAHRKPERSDGTPMIVRQYHCLNVASCFNVENYSNSYYFYDCFWAGKGSGYGAAFGTVTWRFMGCNMRIKGFTNAFNDTGAGLNYGGSFIECDTTGCTNFSNNIYLTLTQPAATHPARNVMGDWQDHPTDANRAIVRVWRNVAKEELPLPYPLAPWGLKLPEGSPAVAPGDEPYIWVDPASDLNIALGNVRNQVSITAAIRDSVGDRRLSDFQSSESGLASIGIKTSRTSPNMSTEHIIIRNGCWLDGAQWKSRLWFTDVDLWTGLYVHLPVDLNITNPTGYEAFLALHTVDHTKPPRTPQIPESIEDIRSGRIPNTVPQITSATSLTQKENVPVAIRLRADTLYPTFAISGGPDAAVFEISTVSGVSTFRFVGNASPDFENPTDADGNNVYSADVTVTDQYGNTSDPVTITVTITDENETVVSPFSDNFNRANEPLGASPNWTERTSGTAQIRISSNQLASSALGSPLDRTVCMAPSTGSLSHYAQALNRQSFATSYLVVSATDEDNWIGLKHESSTTLSAWKRVGGVMTKLGANITSSDASNGKILRIDWDQPTSTLTIKANGVTLDTRVVASPPPATMRAGIAFIQNAQGQTFDDFTSGAM